MGNNILNEVFTVQRRYGPDNEMKCMKYMKVTRATIKCDICINN